MVESKDWMTGLPRSLVCDDPAVIEGFVLQMAKELDATSVVWAVVSGWEYLPRYARHDLDLVVRKRDVRKTREAVVRAATDTGWIVYATSPVWDGASNVFVMKYIASCNQWAYFEVDIVGKMSCRGAQMYPVDKMLARRVKEGGLWHMPIGWCGAHLILKEMFAKGRVEGELRHRYIQNAIRNDLETFRSTLVMNVGSDLASRVIDAACTDANRTFEFLERDFLRCRRSRAFRALISPWAWVGRLTWLAGYVWRCVHPVKRLFVVFIGPDGCGKTTIADRIQEKFTMRPFIVVRRVKFIFGPFSRMRAIKGFAYRMLKGRRLPEEKIVPAGTKGAGMQKPLSSLRALSYVVYYGLNQILGGLQYCHWTPSLPSCVIADRYYYDYFYMRGYVNCPRWVKSLISCFIPKPHLVFYLERNAEVIYARKPELDVAEIRRQQNEIKHFLKGKKFARVIDASEGVEETVARVSRAVEDWLQGRKS